MDKQQSPQQSDKNKNTQKEPKNMEKQQFQQQAKNINKLKKTEKMGNQQAQVQDEKAAKGNKKIPTKPKPNSFFNHALYR